MKDEDVMLTAQLVVQGRVSVVSDEAVKGLAERVLLMPGLNALVGRLQDELRQTQLELDVVKEERAVMEERWRTEFNHANQWAKTAEERLAERNALQADLDQEMKGKLELRARFGAKVDESWRAFLERVFAERQAAEDLAATLERQVTRLKLQPTGLKLQPTGSET